MSLWPTFLSLLSAAPAQAIPLTLHHQGRLHDAAGAPLTGDHELRFAIHDAATGGTELWAQVVPAAFDQGYFAEQVTGLDIDTFATNAVLWFDISVDGGPAIDRVQLDSVPFALAAGWAETAGGLSGGGDLEAGAATFSDAIAGTDASFSGHVQLGESTSPCDSTTLGALRFNETDLSLELCDGAAWVSIAGGKSGTAGNPGRTCKDILAAQPAAPTGTYWIDPTGSDALQVLCDMTTAGGGWTLCGKYDRDNASGALSLQGAFARSAQDRASLVDVETFSDAQASQDCRELVRAGATELLSAGTDAGTTWGAGRLLTFPDEVQSDPSHLWELAKDEDGVGTCTPFVFLTRDLDGVDLDNQDGPNFLSGRYGLLGDGAFWTNQNKSGASFGNAGQPSCDSTTRDTVYWAWTDAGGGQDTHTCGATDGNLTIGTGCNQFAGAALYAPPTYRYNLLLLR